MEFCIVFLVGLVSSKEVVTAEASLDRLVLLSSDILESAAFYHKPGKWVSMWDKKFETNSNRMLSAFYRCGVYDKK